jgi:signal transduction histidine kinase
MFALVILLHFTGGVENPFVFFFVFHIVLASIGLSYQVVYLLSTVAIMMVSLLFGLEGSGVIPHVNLEGFALPTRYQEPSRILAVLTTLAILLYATTYVTTAIAGELRKRQRQVVALRESLLQEKTGELERASTSIAKLEEEKSQFLHFIGIAAHDLKAPLTAIQGFLWVMLGGFAGELSEKQKNMLERSSLRITELLTLISDLLDIARIKTGQIVQEMEEVSLREIIEGSIEDQRNLAEAKGIRLEVEIPEGLPRIKGSASRLQQVLTNLINNAINYTHEGTVTIRAKERDKDLLVEVMDTGIGIPPADMSHLFEDFFRASNVETRGTGLGLSISRRIVEAHGGRIWVESPYPEANRGSKFSFILPKLTETKRRQRR